MKLIMFTDPHCTRSSEFSKPTEDGLNEYLQLFLKSFDFVKSLVLEHKPDMLVFGGDFWDARDFIDTMAVNVGQRVFNELSKLPVKHKLAIVGNHDYFQIDNQIHTLAFLKGLGWKVFESPECIDIDGTLVAGIPYRDEYDLQELDSINAMHPAVVFAHTDVVGGRYRTPKSDKDTKAFSSNGLPASIFNHAGLVMNGHYHHPSKVAENWYNIGSLTSRTFHDKNSDPRGAVLYDTDDNKLRRFINPHARHFVDVHVDSEEDLAELLENDYTNTYARIYYNLELEDEAQTVKEMFAGARLLPIAKRKVQSSATTVDLRFSLEDNLQRFINGQYEDQRLESLALEIFKQVSDESSADSSREPLEFGWLEIRNYQSIGHVKVNLHNRGLLFVRGINNDDPGQDGNGSGKSNFVEALYWCLKGKSLRGYKGNEVIHWDENFTRVSLELFVGDDVYTVVRSRKDPEYGTGVKLFIGGESAGARLSTDTDTQLEDLIGRSEDSLKHVCFMTAGLANRFSNLTYPQRARLLEDIIDSKPYQSCKKLAEQRLGEVKLELSRLSGSIETLTENKESVEFQVSALISHLDNYDDRNKVIRDQAESSIVTAQEEIDGIEKKQLLLDSEIQHLEGDVSSLRSKMSSLDSTLFSMNGVIAGMQAQQSSIRANEARVGALKNQEVCPTCEKVIDQQDILNKLSNFSTEGEGLHQVIIDEVGKLNLVGGRKMKVESAISSRESRIKDKRHSKHSASQKLNVLLSSLHSFKSILSDIEFGRDKLNSQLVERESEFKRICPRLIELIDEEEKLEEYCSRLRILAHDVFDEKGVRNSILSQVAIPYLNAKLPEYSQYLWGGRQLELSGSRELKGGKVKNDIDIVLTGNRTYKGNSSGEKRRVDLIIQFALNDLATATGRSRVGLLVVDEALDTLDEAGIYAAKEALQQKSAGTVLMISHQKYAAAICTRQMTFVKEAGYTRLLEDHTHPVIAA